MTTLKTFIGYKVQKKEIKKYLRNEYFKKALLLKGQYGVGKTLLVNLICEKDNLNIIHINIHAKNVEDTILKMVENQNTLTKYFKNKTDVILLDDVNENVSLKQINLIIKLIEKINIHVVIIITNKYYKNISKLMKHIVLIDFKPLSSKQLLPKLKLRYPKLKDKVIKRNLSSDIRQSIINLNFAQNSKIYMKKDGFNNVFELMDMIIDKKIDNIPYDEFLIQIISSNYLQHSEDINVVSESADSICDANNLNIFTDFGLIPCYTELSCRKPCLNLNKKYVRKIYHKKSNCNYSNNHESLNSCKFKPFGKIKKPKWLKKLDKGHSFNEWFSKNDNQ